MLTAAEWQTSKRAIVDRHATPSDGRGLWQFASVLLPIAALWALIAWTAQGSAWLAAPATFAMSLFLLRGFVLMHDCGHDSLFRSKRLNRVGGFLLGVLAGLPQEVWAHNVASVADYLAMGDSQRRRYRLARCIALAPIAGCLYFLVNPRITWLRVSVKLLRRRVAMLRGAEPAADARLPSAEHYRHMTRNNVVLLTACALMMMAIDPWLFLACYLAGGSLAGGYGLVLFTVQHNFEHSYASADEGWCRNEAALHGTSYLVFPRWLDWFTADAAYHHVHHLCASVPNYRLKACHAEFSDLFASVRRIGWLEIPASMKHILWDRTARRLVCVDEAVALAPAYAAAASLVA